MYATIVEIYFLEFPEEGKRKVHRRTTAPRCAKPKEGKLGGISSVYAEQTSIQQITSTVVFLAPLVRIIG